MSEVPSVSEVAISSTVAAVAELEAAGGLNLEWNNLNLEWNIFTHYYRFHRTFYLFWNALCTCKRLL